MSNRLTFSLASLFLIFVAGFALLIPGTAEADKATFATNTLAADGLSWDAGASVSETLPAAEHAAAAPNAHTEGTFTYSLSPALPSGVTINLQTRAIAGIPAAGVKAKEYTWSATSSTGAAHSPDPIKFKIGVNSAPKFTPDKLADRTIKSRKAVNIQLPAAVDADGDKVASYALAPPLISGLQFDATTRQIVGYITDANIPADDAGTADVNESMVEYTLTATGATGAMAQAHATNDGMLTFTIKYVVNQMPTLVGVSDITGTVGTMLEGVQLPVVPTAKMNKGETITYNLSPALPSGLALNEAAKDVWIISGTPNAVKAETEYTWTATDPDGEKAEVKFKITINAAIKPVALSVTSINDMMLTVGTYSETLLPPAASGTGVAPLMYTLTPALPAGMMFDGATRILKGTPTTAAAAAEYTYKVKDSAKADDGTAKPTEAMVKFKITVNAAGTPVGPTDPVMLSQPTNVMVVRNAAQDGYTVSWTPPTNAAGIGGYYVSYNPVMFVPVGTNMLDINTKPTSVSVWSTADTTAADPLPTAPPTGVTAAPADPAALAALPDIPTPTPTPANNPPTFSSSERSKLDGVSIVVWQGHIYSSHGLPEARDNQGDSITYRIVPDLPSGFELTQDRDGVAYIEVREANKASTVAMKATEYEFYAMDNKGLRSSSDKDKVIKFTITVLAPIKPTMPTGVTAAEEGDLGSLEDNLDREKNSNQVVVKWTAPVDATTTSHPSDPDTSFGAKITGYKVYRSDMNDVLLQTYDVSKADATSFKTPILPIGTYKFEVAAVNSKGTGAKSKPKVAALVANVPSRPSDLRASSVPGAPNSVTLDWIQPYNGGAPIEYYVIYRTLDGGPRIEITVGPRKTYRMQGLDAGRHVFRVAAINYDGLGPESVGTEFPVDVALDPTNRPPTFKREAENITATVGTAFSGVTLPEADDPDDDTITYSLSPRLPAGLTFTASTRRLTGTPTVAMRTTEYAYTATDNGGNTARLGFSITVLRADETPDPDPVVILPRGATRIMGTYNTAMGETTLRGSIAANDFGVLMSEGVPDLELFFSAGGTITLDDGASTAAKTVVVSEILWGLDLGEAAPMQRKRQFIELYNTNKSGSVSVTGWKLKFKAGTTVPDNDIDQVSNVAGAGWVVDIGQSGRVTGTTADGGGTSAPVNIVSMYRNINYNKVQGTEADGERLKGVPGGNARDSWKASTRVTTQVGIVASPGQRHAMSFAPRTPTSVPRSPFIISEIGNDSGGTNDWIELHNVTDSEQSLKNYQLSVVTGTHNKQLADASADDKLLFHFDDRDYKVPAKGFIVIASTHPKSTDLASGRDVSIVVADQEKQGAIHLYVVRSFNLPDSGRTLLILRKNHEAKHLKTPNEIVDVVGTLRINDRSKGTSLWPLAATGAPHGNVIDGTDDEDFRAGKVYQRNTFGGGTGEKHLAVRGYTGIGYDRAAADNPANGGTPGYSKDALKEKVADLSDADITISEVMVDTGTGRTNLPQWIELYNSSMTQAVNLNGWKLAIENASDAEVSAFNATLTLKGMTISPNQTVLIVSTSGRTSDSDHFPDTRVVNLWTTPDHRKDLGMTRRAEQVLSMNGFHLRLTDKDNKLVDQAGNLDGNRRTRDEPTWMIPMSDEPDRRSSLLRVYDARVAVDGDSEDGWILASKTDFGDVTSETYYGDSDDFGTPGYRSGGPLPVSLSKFRPERLDDGSIRIVWITESELNNAGFNILRSDTRKGEYTQLNTSLIAGQGTTSERTTYAFPDTSAKPNVVYYYQIQDVSLDGNVTTLRQSRLKGDVSAAGKLTTTWGELKALQ